MTPDEAAPASASALDSLAPLRRTLIERAISDATGVLAQADSDAAETLEAARAEADALLAAARAQGVADAERVLASQRARAEREARTLVLAAQREAYESTRRAAQAAVAALRDDPTYPRLLATLRARAEAELGPDAVIVEAPGGGIQASRDGRRLDFGLDALVDDLLDRRGVDLEGLWSP